LALAAMPARGLAIEPGARTDGAELAGSESGLDGQTVRLEGEVVSETLAGGKGHVWVNVLSGGVAIGVWAPEALVDELEVLGDWGHTGDTVSVTGVFNQACDTHGGDLDVHATSVALLTRGTEREHPVAYWKLAVGIGGLAVAMAGLRRMRRLDEADAA
jgi:hypothetical protein